MNIRNVHYWFIRRETSIDDLIMAVSIHSAMQADLEAEGFPATEMNELREALHKVELLMLELKQSVITHLESK